jgi:putative transposase
MEKSIYNINENGLSYGRGYVYSLQYHIVWCTKYRRKVLTAGADEDCKQLLLDLAEEYSFRIPAMEVMPDHVHVLIDAKPQFYISDMVKIMKGTLARRLFLLHPEMKEKLWGGHLWNPSYCVVTVSDRSREQVEEYIRSQKEKAWGGKGRPPRDLERLQRYHREVPDADHAMSRNGDAGKQQLPEDHSDASS